MRSKLPICVDLDGTLLRTDVLSEALVVYVKDGPWRIFNLLVWFLKGRAYLKKRIADLIDLDISVLPVNQQIIELIHQYKSQGHKILLVTAAPYKYGMKAADHFGFFDDVMTSQESCNLRSEEKAQALVKRFGEGQFIYVGNSGHDLPVWRHGSDIIAINTPFWVLKKIFASGKSYTILEEGLLKGHEILKLIFIPSSTSEFYRSIFFIVLGSLLLGSYLQTHEILSLSFVLKVFALVLIGAVVKIDCSIKTFVLIRNDQTLSKQQNREAKIFNNALSQSLAQGTVPLGFIIQLALTYFISLLILIFLF